MIMLMYDRNLERMPQFATRRVMNEDENGLGWAPFYLTDVLRMMLFIDEQSDDNIMEQRAIVYMLRIILAMAQDYRQSMFEHSIDGDDAMFGTHAPMSQGKFRVCVLFLF